MRFSLIVVFLFLTISMYSQEEISAFKVEMINKEKAEFKSDYNAFKHRSDYIYEDEN